MHFYDKIIQFRVNKDILIRSYLLYLYSINFSVLHADET